MKKTKTKHVSYLKGQSLFIMSFLLFGLVVFFNSNQVFADTPIEEGIYEIYTNVAGTKVMNIENDSMQDAANVNIYERENKKSQKFQVIENTDETYTLKVLHSNKVLDVAAGGKENGTNVWQYEANGTDAQKWILEPCGDGYYSIQSKCNDLYLDVVGAGTQNGTNIQVYTGNGTKAQKFKFSKVQEIKGEKTIEEGIYQIRSQVAENRFLEIPNQDTNNGVVFRTATSNNRANQKFQVIYHPEDGTYSITVMHTKKVLDVQSAGIRNGTLVQQYSSNGTDAQKWILVKNEDHTYSLLSKCNDLALDIGGASKEVGAIVQTYSYNGTNAQRFELIACQEEKGTQSVEDGTYRILSKVDRNKGFDLAGASHEDGAMIQIWNQENVAQQKFIVEYAGEGYYTMKAKNSNKVLTVENENPVEGSKIIQQENTNADTQKWILKKYAESVYMIVSKCGNLYIDLGDTKAECGQSLVLKSETDLENQQFVLVNETPTKNLAQIEEGVYQITLKSDKVFDIAGANTCNAANVQIWTNERVQQQKFQITRINNSNEYQIVAVHSAKLLDVQGGSINCGANVNQYESNGSDAQKWYFRDCGDGYYNILSKANGLCIDIVAGNIFQSGANAQLYYRNGTDAQKFKLTPIQIIDNNTYEIETKLNDNMVLDVEGGKQTNATKVQLWNADNVAQQRFEFQALSTDTYKIIAKHSNKALTADINTGNVYQSDYSGTLDQKWRVEPTGDGYYSLICVANGKALDVLDAIAINGQNVQIFTQHDTDAQKFRFVTGFRKFYEEGTYGRTGLAVAGDGRGSNLRYYKYGKGSKVLFANFSIHGFEDSYNHDGTELTYIAEEFKKYLDNHIDEATVNNWTIYILPCSNPDGQYHGYTQNGPGRTTLFSAAPGNKGIDMNRNWSIGYKRETKDRNYNGTAPFQAYEATSLRDFMLTHQGIQNITIDTHGWLNETIGDNGLGVYYRNYYGLPTHIAAYGSGYLINWARTLNGGRSVLVELPQVSNHNQVIERNYVGKYIGATMQMLKEN